MFNIFIENTYNGTTSNEDGYFELNISKTGNYTVVFQFLGYKTLLKKLEINQFPHVIDVVLKEENINPTKLLMPKKSLSKPNHKSCNCKTTTPLRKT